TSGLRPDEDLARDLEAEGFKNPLIFRTCANRWLERQTDLTANGNGMSNDNLLEPPPNLPQGEQFADLFKWLELGLTRLEVEAIKARGVTQMLKHLEQALSEASPPDLTEAAAKTKAAWMRILTEESGSMTEVLLD